ncbi:MAG: DNA repair protein RecN [Flavobacteriales bacterium]
MLARLIIRNFVLINELTLNFNSGYTTITGETGSGKSILLNALGLIKGDRADFSVIGPSDSRSIVEAHFSLTPDIKQWLIERSFELWNDVILRREIHKDGKSRAFINDTPVTLQDMKMLGEKLFIIHSQYNTLELKNQEYQLYILDALSGTLSDYNAYANGYSSYIKRKNELALKIQELSSLESKMDYEQFILTEIQALNLHEHNFDELANNLELKEENQSLIADLTSLISISESPILQDLSGLTKTIERHEERINTLQEIKTILQEITVRFAELSYLSNKSLHQLESSDDQGETILEQVDEFNRILNKHRLTTQEALLDFQHELEGRVGELNDLKAFIAAEERAIKEQETSLIDAAATLNTLRKKAIPAIKEQIDAGLSGLKLSGAALIFNLIESTTLNSQGMITLEMLFSANKGMQPVPIQKAASGGELSRVMLLLQQLVSSKLAMPSILFDEIDTGVSGDVAEKIGKLLQEMGRGRQLFAITHLPQVAAQAEHHLAVRKSEINQRIETSVIALEPEDRVTEIARLMSGEVINDAALLNARNLLESNEV